MTHNLFSPRVPERKPELLIHQRWVQTLALGVEVEVDWAGQQLAVTEKLCRSSGSGSRALMQDSCQDWEDPGLLSIGAYSTPCPEIWADVHGGLLHEQVLLVIFGASVRGSDESLCGH